MATLHVRNVPDDLYERLRERAAANGRSIGAEAVVLLQGELGGTIRPWRSMFSRRRVPSTPFQRFTPKARNAVAGAKDEARELGASAVGTEHILLAILKAPGPVVSVVLETAGLDYERGLAAVEGIPRDRSEPAVGMPFTPGAKKAMELALRYCIEMGSSHIGHEHLLLGIAREEDGLGARVLSDAGLDLESIRRKLALAPAPLSYELSVEMAPGFRVVELSGTAQEWEGQLNSLASRGYELVEIVSGKAVFRTLTPET